jgi:iron complex outermembrane receptor protein
VNFNKKQGFIGSERSHRPVSSLLLIMAIAGTGSQQVFAQQPQSSANEPVEEVVVTGSLLATGRGSTSPVTVIGSDSLIENPRPNLSGFFAANVPQHQLEDSNQSNTSRENRTRVQGVSLRGLGAENTLTLVNGLRTPEYGESISIGWRFVPIDQVLPAIALQRMEILLDGGSAIYGTDAVAGVVNLVPDYGFDGVKLQLSGQRYPDASSQRNDTGAFLLGTSNERTSWLSAIEWQKWDHVIQSDLDIFDPNNAVVASSAQYREFAPGTGVGGLGGAAAGNRLIDPLCGKSGYMSGSVTTLAGGPACAQTNWGSGAAGNDQIVRQGNRNAFTFFTGVKHEFTDRLRMELSASYNQTNNDNPTSNSAVVPNTNASSNLAVGTQIPIPANNPGVIRNAQLDPAWSTNTGTNRGFFLPQMNVNNPWEVLTNQINSTYQRLSGTLEYDLTDVWTVKASSVVGSSNVDRYEPSLIADRMRKALAGFGGAGCTGTVAGAGGCQFYNPFFNAREPGRGNSQELLEWMQPSRYTNFVSELTVNQVVLTGDSSDLFELPAGPVGMAVGYEYRVDSWYTDHDPLANAGGYQAQLGGPSRDYPLPFASKSRSNVVDAWFMELAIPVTDTLDVQAAVRNEKYSQASDFSTTNPKLGFNWSVTEDITVRGSWGTSFKAPSVEHTQQPNLLSTTFLTLGNIGLNAVNGPCPSPANVPTGCFIAGGIGQTRVIVALETSPNVNLQPMESDNWSLGFNWDLTDSLTVGMNYVDIKFENVIRNLRPVDALLGLPECGAGYSPDGLFPSNYFIASQRGQDIFTTWGGLTAFPGNPAGYRFPMYLPSSNCFTLDAKGMPTKGFQSPINVSERHIQSLDFNLTYTLDTAFGRFSVSPNAAITLAWKERALPADPEIDYTGFRPTFGGGIQEYRANMPITWTNDGTHTIIFTPRYLSKLDNYLSGNPEDDFIYYDLNYLWAVNDEMRVTFFANNVFNQFPTMHQIANTGSGQYPRDGVILGASFEMSYAF